MIRAARLGLIVLTGIVLVAGGVRGLARPLTILYTNDLHLRFARLGSIGDMIDQERGTGAAILLVDGGDGWQDFRTPLAAVWGADEMVQWMNDVGYDAMAIGNHELYWGSDRLAELAERATFAVLCANLETAPGFSRPFVSSVVRSVDGIRIFLVGVVTPHHIPYPDFPWLRYVAPARAIQAEIAEISEPVDLIVVVGHVPVEQAVGIVREIPMIDVFVTGHSHEETHEPVLVGESFVVQSGRFGERLGRLVIDVNEATREVRLISNDLMETDKAPTASGRGVLQFVAVVATLALTALLVLL
jgi:5'-nucleotidase